MSDPRNDFLVKGWAIFPPEKSIKTWAACALSHAVAAISSKGVDHEQMRCGGTWFVGLDALPNDARGRLPDGPQLSGSAVDFAHDLGPEALALHKAQVSTIYPDYPKPMVDESEAAFRFRQNRDAAHLDGVLPVGPNKRRMLREPHAYVLGIPLNTANAQASPLVVWEGSHEVFRAAFHAAFAGVASEHWRDIDVTSLYNETRKVIFSHCTRKIITCPVGGAYVIHRLALHGVTPWQSGAQAAREGRMIAYFRPELVQIQEWLKKP